MKMRVPLFILLPLLRWRSSSSFVIGHTRTKSFGSYKYPYCETECQVRVKPDVSTETTDNTEALAVSLETVAAPLALLLISQLILFIGVGAVIPSIPLYGKAIGLSSAANGVVISAPAVALVLGSKWGANFADLARKPAMLVGMAVIAASDIGTALSANIFQLVVARLGLGLGRCLSEAGERGMLADLAGRVPEQRGRVLAAQQVSIALGIAVGAPLGGLVVEEYGPRASFLCVSAGAVLALVMYSFLPETMASAISKEKKLDSESSLIESIFIAPSEAIKEEDRSALETAEWGKLLATNQWRALAFCQCGATFGFAAKIASIPLLATSILGSATGAGALVSACGLSGLVGGPLGGWLTDQTSARTAAIWSGIFSASALLCIPVALSGDFYLLDNVRLSIPFLIGDLQGQALAFTMLVIGWSVGAAAQGPALTALAQELAPQGAESTALALPRVAGDGTYIVAPFLLGLVADASSTSPGLECAVAGMATFLGVSVLTSVDATKKGA